MERQTFHQSVRKILFISQCFGVLPVSNMWHKNVFKLQYKWLSMPTIYCGIVMILNLLEFGTVINFTSVTGVNFHASGTISLFSVCTLEHFFFWRLARKWPQLMQQWRQVEELFRKVPYQLYVSYNMTFWIWFWYLLIMFGGGLEHALLVFNSFQKSDLERTQCNLNVSYWETLYGRERPHLLLVLPYQIWALPAFEWLNLTLAYPRSFTDVFIIIVSIGLAVRFRQLYLRMKDVQGKPMPAIFWLETREHYLVLRKLLRLVNDELSALILLACANNLYFICFQLFNSFFNIGVDWVAEMAFWYSLVYNIVRTMLTFYLASLVDEYTKKIVSCLREVPSKSWCNETHRFSEQLSVDVTTFTAAGFFTITRKLILGMAGTIVTYQLMVMDVINQGSIKQVTDYCKKYQRFDDDFEQNDETSVES